MQGKCLLLASATDLSLDNSPNHILFACTVLPCHTHLCSLKTLSLSSSLILKSTEQTKMDALLSKWWMPRFFPGLVIVRSLLPSSAPFHSVIQSRVSMMEVHRLQCASESCLLSSANTEVLHTRRSFVCLFKYMQKCWQWIGLHTVTLAKGLRTVIRNWLWRVVLKIWMVCVPRRWAML